ncbi:MAG: alpha/beta fold hydrolase [Egibacteraceae bacterium]
MLHVNRCGQGEPLVLIHGLGAHWRLWEPVLPLLEPHHDVWVPDVPGCGQSLPLVNDAPEVRWLANALETAMDEVGFSTVHIVGHSLGGVLALELGRRGRAKTVCAISPPGKGHPWEDRYAIAVVRLLRAGARALYPALPMLARPAVLRTLMMWPVASRPWRMDAEWTADLARTYADAKAFNDILAADRTHVTDEFDQITCPVVIAWGSGDRLLFPRQGPRYARAIPNARLVRLLGVGHACMGDDPLAVVDLILRTTRLGEREPRLSPSGCVADAEASTAGMDETGEEAVAS